jgi:hypothetical protein
MRYALAAAGLTFAAAAAFPVAAQTPDNGRIEAQRQAMAPLAFMDGIWRGPAWSITRDGRHEVTQAERIGPFLGGVVKVMEGRGYNADGSLGFNAFGTISYDPTTHAYTLHSCALGYCGDFPFEPRPGGYVWQVPAGPGAVIRYTATVGNDRWREVGERIAGNAPPVQIFEMNLRRVGDTDWPAGNPVPMR